MPSPLFTTIPSPHAGLSLKLLDIRQQPLPLDLALEHLSEAEQTKASRYRQTADQRRFVYGRWALRWWLGQLLGLTPAEVLLGVGPQGKPLLANRLGPHFNLSHAGDYVLLGLHEAYAVGVDIEQANLPAPLEVMPGIFSPDEQRYCQAKDDDGRFYTLWTAKEAVLKAWGTGLTDKAAELSVIDAQLHWRQQITPGTQVWPITVPAGYAAAVALSVDDTRS